ncbi:pseudouridine-5'-phosphate glycosidase [Bacillota bacterium]
MKNYLDIKPEVKDALEKGTPVIALESTIIAHGMPFPKNVETAIGVENIIRSKGAVPATIGIIGGRIKVGLTGEEIDYLAKAKNVVKVSRRDFPLVLAGGLDGATTVAGTMIVADEAGISLFVTGGIGGVHRGASATFDISADLEELKQTRVTVVCAGVKSILDIGGTLEYLETGGVPVITYDSDEFPAFYSRRSGFPAECRVNEVSKIAALLKVKDELRFRGGAVVACPIPEEHEIDFETMDITIREALKECEEKDITGKRVTPFLLDRIKELTEGRSLEANIQLVLNNARVGGEIAAELIKLGK